MRYIYVEYIYNNDSNNSMGSLLCATSYDTLLEHWELSNDLWGISLERVALHVKLHMVYEIYSCRVHL